MLYLDTSALVRLYIWEPGSREVEALVKENQPWVFTSLVAFAETFSMLLQSLREGRITGPAYQRQKRAFLTDWDTWHVVGLSQPLLRPVERLIERYGLQGFDAIHLCTALSAGHPEFACFDARLRAAAGAEGLPVVPELTAGR
jgi:predicted nucleic acid-binding protein